MIGINKAPISLDLETCLRTCSLALPKAIGRGEIIAVVVQNPLINTDGTNNNSTIFLGSPLNDLFDDCRAGKPIVYAEDQKDVYVRLDFPRSTLTAASWRQGLAVLQTVVQAIQWATC